MSEVSVLGHRVAEAVAQTASERFCHPTATYRLQFEKDHMTFRAAAAVVPYLNDLGISHLYPVSLPQNSLGHDQRLCHCRLRPIEPRLGQRSRLSVHDRGLARLRNGADSRHGAEPYERDGGRKPLVERRAGEWPRLAPCGLFRHRLAARQRGAARPNPPAHSRQPVWAGPRIGRAEAGVSPGQLLRAVLPVALAAGPAELPRRLDPRVGRAAGSTAGGFGRTAGIGEHCHGTGTSARTHGNRV